MASEEAPAPAASSSSSDTKPARYSFAFDNVLTEIVSIHKTTFRHDEQFRKATDAALRAFEFRRRPDSDVQTQLEHCKTCLGDVVQMNVPPLAGFDELIDAYVEAKTLADSIKTFRTVADERFKHFRTQVDKHEVLEKELFSQRLAAKVQSFKAHQGFVHVEETVVVPTE
jgi:histidinol-phosphate/aromatic aminotransferase/cobyric acid decarboxylase-like protein